MKRAWLAVLILSSFVPAFPRANAGGGADDAQTFLRVNQLGYRTRGAKVAVAFAAEPPSGRFSVVDAGDGRVAFEGDVRTVAGGWGRFQHHGELDFSALERPGRYFLRLGRIESSRFDVGEAVYALLPDRLLEFMRQQRCGYNPFLDAVCHPFDGRTAYGPAAEGTYLDATGGWHDAGDQLKYLLTSGNATAQMLLAYQLAGGGAAGVSGTRPRSIFGDEFNEWGQPGGNSTPDVLYEWMTSQSPTRSRPSRTSAPSTTTTSRTTRPTSRRWTARPRPSSSGRSWLGRTPGLK
jgi:hypothetical protein